MHKKFIKKENKTFGPYYYTTIRDSGKIKSFYLGQDEEIARQKEKEIKKKYDVKELSHTLSYEQEPRPVLPYIALALLITAVLVFPFILQFRLNGLFIGLESVSYEKIQDDPTFDVIVDSVSFEGNDLVVNFHHNSEQAQPVLVMGNISFSLSTDILGPGETAQLAVQDWDGSYFELKVGNESEIIAFYVKYGDTAQQSQPEVIINESNLSETREEILSQFTENQSNISVTETTENINESISEFEFQIEEFEQEPIFEPLAQIEEKISAQGITKIVYSSPTTGVNWTVPDTVTEIIIKAWGAGGGGGGSSNDRWGGAGGGGGYATAQISVTPGENLTVRVGGGGAGGQIFTGLIYPAGQGGGGGGYSGVFRNTVPLVIAAGGGGGGGANGDTGSTARANGTAGGAGGGLSGINGTSNGGTIGGGGGTQTAGGAGGATNGSAGSSLNGGNGGSQAGAWGSAAINGGGRGGNPTGSLTQRRPGGGGGGGGYYGGGGGGFATNRYEGGAGGGGGSSYLTGTNTLTVAGSGTNPGNTTDEDYGDNAGRGGSGGTPGQNGTAGNPGRVVIIYYLDTTPPQWSNQGQNTSSIFSGESIKLFAHWTDDRNLSHAVLETNETGTWQNKTTYGSPLALSGNESWSNFTWQNTSISAGTIGWRIWANDSVGNWNVTNVMIFIVQTDNPPEITLEFPPDNYYNDTSQYVNLTFNASVTDDYALVNCSLWHNYTGTWHLNQTQTVTGKNNVTNFSLNNLTNKTFIWNIQCYDNASQSAFAPANRTVILNWTPYNTSIDISLLRLDYSTFPTNDSYNFIGEALEMGEMHHFWPAVNYSYANGSPVSGADISAIFGKDAGIYYGYFGFDPPHIHNHTKIYDFTLKEDNYIAVNFTDVYNLTESNSLSITFAVCKVGQSDVTGEVRINNQLSWTGSSLIGNIFSNQTSQCPSDSLVYLKNISAFKDADSFYIMIGCPNCSNSEYYVVPRTNNTNGWFVPNRSLQTESGDSGWQLMPDSEQNNWVIYVHKYFDNFSDFNFTYNSSTGLYIDKSRIYVTEEDSITNITANASKQDHKPATKTEYIVNLPIGTIVNIDDLIDSVTVHQNPQNGTTVEYGNITLIWSAFHPRGIDYFYSNLTYANGSTISYNDTAFVVHWSAELFTEINTIYNLTVWANSTTGENESEVLWFYVNDTLAPSIYYNPNTTENGTYSKNWIFINVTCSDLKKDTVILNWNGSNESFDNNEGDIYWENKTGLNEGIYTFYAWCNDTSGNSNQTETRIITIYFNKAPQISLNEPSNNTQLNDTQDMNFNFTATDDLNTTLNCSIYLDDNLNQTNSSTLNNTLTNFLIQGISYGSHNWSISCTDGELSNVSETRYFVIADTIGPTILFVSPTPDNNTVLSRDWVTINASVSDTASNIDTCILEWNGSNESMTKVGSGPNVTCYANKTGLTGNTNYTYKVYANDTSNNWNVSETRNVFIGTPPSVVILHPSPGEVFDENNFISLVANITDPDGLNLTVAEVTLPNSSKQNVTLYIPPNADNFDTNTVGIAWAIE
ncbi:MAG: hypothetical protein QW561_01380, partial [Candidatus Aenigmatarchaeota archaeon]